jgi:hypothetical protein
VTFGLPQLAAQTGSSGMCVAASQVTMQKKRRRMIPLKMATHRRWTWHAGAARRAGSALQVQLVCCSVPLAHRSLPGVVQFSMFPPAAEHSCWLLPAAATRLRGQAEPHSAGRHAR